MFYKRQIYKRNSQDLPSVGGDIPYNSNVMNLDRELVKLIRISPKLNYENSATCYWMDGPIRSYVEMFIRNIIGKRLTVQCDNPKQTKLISSFNRAINVNGQTIEDYMVEVWIDNIIYGYSLWRIAENLPSFDDEPRSSVDIQRISPASVQRITDDITGLRKFVQTSVPIKAYKTPEDFLLNNPTQRQYQKIIIPDDQRLVLYTSFFTKPPMYGAIPYITLKHWIVAFIHKYSEKMWAPLMMAYVGTDNNYPQGDIQMTAALKSVSKTLASVKNFAATAFPGNTRVDVHQLQNSGDVYIKFLDKMDEQALLSVFSSIGARQSNKVYRGNDNSIGATTRMMEQIRNKIEIDLKRFYVTNIVIGYDEDKIHFIWDELKTTTDSELTKILEIATKSGIFKDARERRRAFSSLIPFLTEYELTDEEAEQLQNEMITILAPSQPNETTVNAVENNVQDAREEILD